MGFDPITGDQPAGWRVMTIGDAVDEFGGAVLTGPFGSQLHASDYVPQGIPLIMPKDIKDDRVSIEGIARVRLEDAERLAKHRVEVGDIVYSRRGDVERRALIGTREAGWLCGTGCLRVRLSSPKVDNRFAYYFLGHPSIRAFIVRHAHGATMPNLNTAILRNVPFVCPPLDEQRRIAAVLGALDDKIELNRKMNRTLEAMAQALFKSWFIDFDGVPDSDLVESELGPIPKGWAVESLDSVADFLNGAACQKYPAIEGEESLPVIKIRELNQGVTAATERATAKIPRKWWVDNGDVLFSWSGSLVVKVWTGGRGALNQHLFKVTSARFPRWFFLLWTRLHLRDFQRIAADKATTMGHIKRHHLTDARCLVPIDSAMARFDEIMSPLVDKQVACEQESQTLSTLRDTLLPKLISGEVRVPEAEAAVEAVL